MRFARKNLLVGVGLIAATSVAVVVGFYVHRKIRQVMATKRLMCVGGALLSYESAAGTLPPAQVRDAKGRLAHSWRVLLLPYLGYSDLFRQYNLDEPWDSLHNQELIPNIPGEYQAANSPMGYTDIVAIVGKGTVWPGPTPASLDGVNSSTTIMLFQARDGRPWTKPDDVTIEKVLACQGMPGGFSDVLGPDRLYISADCAVRVLPAEITKEELQMLLTTAFDKDYWSVGTGSRQR